MALPTLTPASYRRVTLVALVALTFIIVSGAAVRLTGSGLGCPDWPTCARNRVVAPLEYHAMVEFVNRTVTGLVSVAVILAVLGSLRRTPRRRDLTWLSVGLVAGVVGQIVLGGLTVLFELRPGFVMAHFLLSMAILADAVVLHDRAGRPDDHDEPAAGPDPAPGWVADRDLRRLGGLVVVAAGLVLFLGTVVTSSGPHGGDENAERLQFALPEVARFHGASVFLFLGLTLVTLWRLRAAPAPAAVLRRGEAVLAVSVAQAAIGYIQYFNGVPALLVGFHVAGATAVWVAALRFRLALTAGVRERRLEPA
ncbi:MAG: heme a synthase [Actinomycetota bacterium]|jgi:cytochrome c oxidase assembly protein subunit 15|nr:heme a synthase [Actinomycetota bacterium]